MQRVMLDHGGITMTPKQKRLSVGFGTNASVQIHKTATPTHVRQWCTPTTTQSICNDKTDNLDDAPNTNGRRKSLHEALLMRLLSTPSEELLDDASDGPESQRTADDSFDSCLSGRSTPFEMDLLCATPDAMRCHTPPAAESLPPTNRHMQLLMRDYNSPSATARLRAVRALNSVSQRNAYGNFDVSYAEQDIITAEERIEQGKRTIQEVMRDVCVYVEVRSGTDNRSDGIKEHIASLGAKVNERLLKDTTHVVFKDGLLSTYQKAKKMNVPVVSILWIEACKRHTCLMNPNDFRISNLERYENPEMFKRIRRQKSMQPGAEETIGAKKRTVTAAKGKVTVVNSAISPPAKLPVLHRIRNDDRLERILNDFEADNQISSPNSGPIDEYDQLLQAAPMRMLERFRSTPTPMDRTDGDASDVGTPSSKSAADSTSSASILSSRARRKTVMFTPQMSNVQEEPVPKDAPLACEETPKHKTVRTRRKTIVVSNDLSLGDSVAASPAVTMTRRTIRTRRSTMAFADTTKEYVSPTKKQTSPNKGADLKQQHLFGNDSSLHIVSVPDHTPVLVPIGNRRNRRKTIAFGNEENTPPTLASMDISKKGPKTIVNRGTICSPQDMDVSRTIHHGSSIVESIGGLTTLNSKGSSMEVTTTSGANRTLFNRSSKRTTDQTSIRSSTMSSAVSGRRRTLFTPDRSTPIEPLEVSETPPSSSHLSTYPDGNGSSIVNQPNPTSSSTPRPSVEAGINRRKTILEQYENTLTFSSTRAPDRRRRTVFDITMDIMDHRLSEINRQAAAAKESSIPEPTGVLKSPPPAAGQQTALHSYYRKASKSNEKVVTDAVIDREVPKKRKLFNVHTAAEHVAPTVVRTTPVAITKPAPKRRSLAPASVPIAVSTSAKKRRTTALFQSPIEPGHTEEQKKIHFPVGRGLPTMASQYQGGTVQNTQQQPRRYLATTNLHTEQSAFVQEAISKLDGFVVEATVSDNTTHLLTLESRRTINLLRALIRGLWIVRYEWIVESHRVGRWLPEERFELREFSPAVQINRSERQAFGSRYRSELFTDYGPFWVSSRCVVPVGQLRELLVLCRAKITGNRSRAKFLVVEPDDNDCGAPAVGQICVIALWILDSITVNKVKKLSRKYRVG